tara:strand:+ start:1947 stop:2369 length:423 start_codon:yes stop_codon:yes gene_type:complete
MKVMLLFFFMSMALAPQAIFGQEIKKCDSGILKNTSDQLDHLTPTLVLNFLSTFDQSCVNNAEFSEWSNELLFTLLNQNTEMVLLVIQDKGKDIDKKSILKEMESQTLDKVDILKLIEKVKKVKLSKDIKDEVISRLSKN